MRFRRRASVAEDEGLSALRSAALAVSATDLRLSRGYPALRRRLVEQRGGVGSPTLQQMPVPESHRQGFVP